jgi:hypothetical protein
LQFSQGRTVGFGGAQEASMVGLIMKMIRFRLGQKIARGSAKKLGLRPVSGLMGIVGGFRMM